MLLAIAAVTPAAATTVTGTATWYCGTTSACTRGYGPGDMVAAIDPKVGIPKGTIVLVSSGERTIRVRIVDVCACAGRRVIDLTSGAFRRLAPLSRGVIPVRLVTASRGVLTKPKPKLPYLPPTDTGPAIRAFCLPL